MQADPPSDPRGGTTARWLLRNKKAPAESGRLECDSREARGARFNWFSDGAAALLAVGAGLTAAITAVTIASATAATAMAAILALRLRFAAMGPATLLGTTALGGLVIARTVETL